MVHFRFLSEQIKQADFLEVLENLSNPVSPNVELGSLQVESCRIMDSAKRPLWLVWQNNDPLAQKIGKHILWFDLISLISNVVLKIFYKLIIQVLAKLRQSLKMEMTSGRICSHYRQVKKYDFILLYQFFEVSFPQHFLLLYAVFVLSN